MVRHIKTGIIMGMPAQGITMNSKLLAASVFTLFASTANAFVLDFTIPTGGFVVEGYVDRGGSTAPDFTGGAITSEAGFAAILLDVDGENVDISLWDASDGNPYFDADSGGQPGGLGSCRVLDANAQCDPSSDDNLTISANEILNFKFRDDSYNNLLMTFGDFTFRDDDHNLFNGVVQVSHDNGNSLITVTNGIGDLSVIGASNVLNFNDQAGATDNYYISQLEMQVVPVPAAVWLFGSALGLLGWSRRR